VKKKSAQVSTCRIRPFPCELHADTLADECNDEEYETEQLMWRNNQDNVLQFL
jgi:LPS O-antigen subunit length determinant protein (WzzB/FepE family)